MIWRVYRSSLKLCTNDKGSCKNLQKLRFLNSLHEKDAIPRICCVETCGRLGSQPSENTVCRSGNYHVAIMTMSRFS